MLYIRDIIRIHNSSKYDTWMRLEMELYTKHVAFEANMLMHHDAPVDFGVPYLWKNRSSPSRFFGLL